MEPERLVVGRIVKAHGIRGEVAVDILSDQQDRFSVGARVYAGERVLVVASSRPHHDRLLVRFDAVDDRTEAEALRGNELTIPSEEAAPLDEWSFYPHQLVGLSVVDPDGRTLGTMLRVEESPAADLWVVRAGHREVLVPAVREIIVSVDLAGGRIVVRPPDGLF
ncbi:MAG: ribosome maturation factor RimM [Actinomycetota bacterium]